MKMEIHISRLRLRGHHGLLPQERIVGADFLVSLQATVETDAEAIRQDRIEGTVSYADVVNAIRQEMAQPANLLETLALRIGERLLRDFPRIVSLTLRIEKENPPIGALAEGIGVSITLPQ